MTIPDNILTALSQSEKPMDNNYFNHAASALKALKAVTEDTYCYDHLSMAANTLERIYKGFIKAAEKHLEWYSIPADMSLTQNHDILGFYIEIKQSFPNVFPRIDRDEWRATKEFLRDLRSEYTQARYESYPAFEEFQKVLKYVEKQYEIIQNAVEAEIVNDKEEELPLDF